MREIRRAGGWYVRLIGGLGAGAKLPLHIGEYPLQGGSEGGSDRISSAPRDDAGEVLNIFNRTSLLFYSVKYI